MIVKFFVILLVLYHILSLPSNGMRYKDGHLYRASCDESLHKLSELRIVARRVLEGLPSSIRKFYVLWKLKRCVFVEIPMDAKKPYVALTIDKGREIEICLDYSDKETLYYVLMHELAHVMSFTTGHNKEFYKNMERLLRSAKDQRIYTGSSKRNVVFCGSHIYID